MCDRFSVSTFNFLAFRKRETWTNRAFTKREREKFALSLDADGTLTNLFGTSIFPGSRYKLVHIKKSKASSLFLWREREGKFCCLSTFFAANGERHRPTTTDFFSCFHPDQKSGSNPVFLGKKKQVRLKFQAKHRNFPIITRMSEAFEF